MDVQLDNVTREKNGTLTLFYKIDGGKSRDVQGRDMTEIKGKLRAILSEAKTAEDTKATLKDQAQATINELTAELGLTDSARGV